MDTRALRRFGVRAAIGFGVLALAAHFGWGPFALFGPKPAVSACLVALALWAASASLFAPRLNRPLQRGLRAVFEPLARAIALFTLAVFFYGVLTPIALIARRFGHDPLLRDDRNRRESYWRPHRARDKSSYFHQS